MKRVKLISIQVERVEKAPLDDQGVSRESIDDLSRLNNYLRRWEL